MLAQGRAPEGVQALASVVASRYRQFELLVLADGSSDGAHLAISFLLEEHPTLPALLLHQSVERGVARSRNVLVAKARGEYVFVLDAQGGIYPSTLERLVRALDADPRATFAYPMVAAYEGDRVVQLLSSLPWEPERLGREDWIDGMALIRRQRLLELGGYSTDPRLAGYDDFYLWCKCAAVGAHGVHVPQVLAWTTKSSDMQTSQTRALMRELFPRLSASDAPAAPGHTAPTIA
ncbi:MAG TPA: glycosyltransferase family 2 protein [Solirubrobacteraceae bacterium]|nr:glycosyltransferase family 2 protein [Solirubrobacteraceae bacterium]